MDQLFASLTSAAQPSTKAVSTPVHSPVPCAYSSRAWPTPLFHSSEGMAVKFQETGILPAAV